MSVPRPPASDIPDFMVKLDGEALEGELAWQIRGVTVEDHVEFPSMFTIELVSFDTRGADAPWLDDYKLFAFGAEVEIALGYMGRLQSLIEGEITALEPEFSEGLPSMAVRGYDRRHRLQRGRKVRTFVKMKDGDIAAKIAKEAGLSADVAASSVTHEYLVQANQTDLEFLQERARRINYEVGIDGTKLRFRPVANDTSPSLTLSIAADLSEFRARLTVASQVTEAIVRGWDAKEKKDIVAVAPVRSVTRMAGQKSGAALAKEAFGAAQELILTSPVMSRAEADLLAQARLNALALTLIQGEGVCRGDPELRAGRVIDIQGLGKRFSGPYYVVSASHRYGSTGYSTHFTVWRNAT